MELFNTPHFAANSANLSPQLQNELIKLLTVDVEIRRQKRVDGDYLNDMIGEIKSGSRQIIVKESPRSNSVFVVNGVNQFQNIQSIAPIYQSPINRNPPQPIASRFSGDNGQSTPHPLLLGNNFDGRQVHNSAPHNIVNLATAPVQQISVQYESTPHPLLMNSYGGRPIPTNTFSGPQRVNSVQHISVQYPTPHPLLVNNQMYGGQAQQVRPQYFGSQPSGGYQAVYQIGSPSYSPLPPNFEENLNNYVQQTVDNSLRQALPRPIK